MIDSFVTIFTATIDAASQSIFAHGMNMRKKFSSFSLSIKLSIDHFVLFL